MINKTKLIAETAWHHDGDFPFMQKLVADILKESKLHILKMHVTLDVDEYIHYSHELFGWVKSRIFSKDQWKQLISTVQSQSTELMLLFNDIKSVEFGMKFNPEFVEIHNACLNDIYLLDALKNNIDNNTFVVFGIGGSTLYEIENALDRVGHQNVVLMFGFQNFPTRYEEINFKKIQKIMNLFPEFSYGYADHTAWNEPNNILITIMGAALGVDYIEKHVTNVYGQERVDWNSSVSIEMFNEIAEKLDILSKCRGDGLIKLNRGEEEYSLYGPMKKAAVLKIDVRKGDVFSIDQIHFKRTKETTDMSQLDVIKSVGREIVEDLEIGLVLNKRYFKIEK